MTHSIRFLIILNAHIIIMYFQGDGELHVFFARFISTIVADVKFSIVDRRFNFNCFFFLYTFFYRLFYIPKDKNRFAESLPIVASNLRLFFRVRFNTKWDYREILLV